MWYVAGSSIGGDRVSCTPWGRAAQRVGAWALWCGLAFGFWGGLGTRAGADEVTYNRHIRPILAAKCFRCHGADAAQRQAELRLDIPAAAYADRDGRRAILPGKATHSEVIRRVAAEDPDVVMPPPKTQQSLTERERTLLQRWIDEGARYERHWAFVPPVQVSLPMSGQRVANPIDCFVHARLQAAGLTPQPHARREQLLRRVSLDLTGLPPTLPEVDRFLQDAAPDAYDRAVDRLLASPRYGERMAAWWLDGARYGDSHGYDNDLENSQWPWRNWVIEAFNQNQPFDQFTIEQLAGDLLPAAQAEQVLATGFQRNHRIQTEDGAIDEEWRTEYVMDRVETMGAVWLGLTLGCARCHDHKYDPIGQREFYQLFAMFNQLDEKGFINNLRGSAEPRMRYRAAEYAAAAEQVRQTVGDEKQRAEQLTALDRRYPWVMIMRDMPEPRQTYLLARGQYDAPTEAVRPGIPAVLRDQNQRPVESRLGLARWLVSGQHPLTGRVLVNRLWDQLFGTGIVKSSENLGVQSEWPSHPALLDWLAVDVVRREWDVKQLLRRMVTSATYCQQATVDAQRLELDPENRLLSRGPRVRLSAEMIRDQALFVSGLLCEEMLGPSVRTYQPAGLWEEVEKRGTYQRSRGQGLYRRSLYTAIRRTVVSPQMLLFDMPSREVCAVQRARTNTPLQALALMNDVTYVEAARKFAERMWAAGSDADERIGWGFRQATQRPATAAERKVLVMGYQRRLASFQQQPEHATQLLGQGESEPAVGIEVAELAALTTVANVLLNLDQIINK